MLTRCAKAYSSFGSEV